MLKIKKMRPLCIVLLFLLGNVVSFSQNLNTDSTLIDSLQVNLTDTAIQQDTIVILQDSISVELQEDTILNDSLKQIELMIRPFDIDTIGDSLRIHEIEIDTLQFTDSSDLIIKNLDNYEDYMAYLNDSLIFERTDSIYYVMYQLEKSLKENLFAYDDTLYRAVKKVIDYRKNLNIESALSYLKNRFETDSTFANIQVKSEYDRKDSLLLSLKYILNSIPDDSLILTFTNLNRDSISMITSESEKDSVLFKLYDNRGEYGVMWIKKFNENNFKLELEEGIFLEKTKQRRIVQQGLDTETTIPKLMKVDKVNLIVPIWKFEGSADIKFNQGYISPSWAEGGESSMSLLSVLKYDVNYTYGKKKNFDFDFEYRLGYLKAGESDLQKNDDKLELNFKYGTSAFNDWYYSGLLNFKSQILKGYEYVNDTAVPISKFFSPASVVFSLGLDYKPSKKLTFLISPVTSKFTIVADTVNYDQTRFGVAKDEKIRKEIGAYIKAISKLKFRESITMENRVNFFTNYVEDPQNIDIDWEIDIAFKVTDHIKMSVNAHLIYDDNVAFVENGVEKGPRIQFKELFGIGFTYKF